MSSISPAGVVSGRTLIGALVLLPIAIHRGALRPALRVWPWVLVFGALEMGGPFLLLSNAERTIPSGLTGLLVSTVPLWAAVIGFMVGDEACLVQGLHQVSRQARIILDQQYLHGSGFTVKASPERAWKCT